MIRVGGKVIVRRHSSAPVKDWGRVGIVSSLRDQFGMYHSNTSHVARPQGALVNFGEGGYEYVLFFYINEIEAFEEEFDLEPTFDPNKEFNNCIRCGTSTRNTIKNFSGVTHAVCCECKIRYVRDQYRKVSG